MKKLIAALVASLLCSFTASADEAVNKKCPMSGKPVDAAQTTTVTAKVGFCCEKCQGKFESADAKTKADMVKKHAGDKELNKKCPTSGKPVADGKTAEASLTVGFCCEKCKAEFDKDVKKNIAKVK